MSASRWPSCSPTAPRSPRTRLRRSCSTSRRCRPSPTATQRGRAACSSSMRPAATRWGASSPPQGRCRARLRRGGLPPPRAVPGAAPHRHADGAARPARRMGRRAAACSRVSGAAKMPFINRRMPGAASGPRRERDPHGRERCRRRLRRARRVLSGGFPHRLRGAPASAARSNGSRTGASISWPPTIRPRPRRARSRSPAAATARSSACAAPSMPISAPISAPTARPRRATTAQVAAGPYRVPNIRIDVDARRHQQDAGRHLSRARPVRGRFLPRAAVRHGGARSRHRPVDIPPPQPDRRARDAVDARGVAPYGSGEIDSGDYRMHARSLPRGIRLGRARNALQGRLIDGRYHGSPSAAISRAAAPGRTRTRASRRTRRLGLGLCRLGSVGQGIETIFAQIAADALELPIEPHPDVLHGSTAYVTEGFGSYSSRSTVMGGSAICSPPRASATSSRRGGAAAGRGARRGRDRRRHRGGARRRTERSRSPSLRAICGGGSFAQHEAHLQLWRPRGRKSRSIRAPARSRSSTMSRSRMSGASSIR